MVGRLCYHYGQGEAPETTKERDGHGLPYTFPDGTTANVGVILPGVTPDGKTNTTVVNSWWKYAGNYQSWDNQPIVRSNSIFTNSWGKLRELSLTYRLPVAVVSKTKIFQSLALSLIGRDLFYLFTKLPDRLNPEPDRNYKHSGYPIWRIARCSFIRFFCKSRFLK